MYPATSLQSGRRRAIKQILAAAAVVATPRILHAETPSPSLRVSTDSILRIPPAFMGLSYESSQLSHPQFFSSSNHDLIQFFRTLGTAGILRIGGNMSEFTVWDPKGTVAAISGEVEGPDPGKGTTKLFPITPLAIDNLAGFLRATGWKLIYGLNLARGDASSAAEEAKYVAATIGDRLVAFQFGNEPDLFKHNGDKTHRWTYDEFIAKWKSFYAAVHTALPHAPIAGPDTSFNPKWVERFAQDVGHDIALQTNHYYAEGPPTDPRMTIDYLLHPGERLQSHILSAIEVAKKSGIPYRMSEGNTCYSAGKKGVSDTFASALWAADFMLSVAQAGGTGVNLHGGGNGLYTPIAGSPSEGFVARPIYYGMLFAAQFLDSTLLKTDLDSSGKNIAAYAARTHKQLQLAIINREPAAVSIALDTSRLKGSQNGSIWRLEAPSIESTSNVSFAKATVSPNGLFHAATKESISLRKGNASLTLAAYSAALVTLPIN